MLKHLSDSYQTKSTPQTQPIPGSNQVPNSAGGYSFEVDDWSRLDRFLILGTQGGTYYVSEKKLTIENAEVVRKLLSIDGSRVVNRIVEISEAGRAPKNEYALYALAMATKFGDNNTRKLAFFVLPKVARTGTHLFTWIEYRQAFGGWGRGTRTAVANWYLLKDIKQVAYQAVKYRQRDGWTHKDVLRLSHPHTDKPEYNQLFKWILKKDLTTKSEGGVSLPSIVEGFEKIQETKNASDAAKLISKYDLPREAVPTALLTDVLVWEALLEKMPMTAMIRNLANMTRIGLLKPMSGSIIKVVNSILDQDQLHKSRIHPISILAALMTYKTGQSTRDSNKSWTVIPQIVDALDEAFYLSFKNVVPSNKRMMLALDVSGSMSQAQLGSVPCMTAREGSAAMAMVTAKTEPNYMINAFSGNFIPLNLSKKQRLDDVIQSISNLPFDRTDCSLPMVEALKNKWEIDTFVIYTDSETYMGNSHPVQALEQYSNKMGIKSKLIVVGMTSNGFTIADPKNPLMLDIVGFDTNTPSVISEFTAG